MKQRQGFVSNSSSCSFVIPTALLSDNQIESLKHKCSVPVGMYQDSWDVYIDEYRVTGFTPMKNNARGEYEGDLFDWMEEQGFPMNSVKIEY